VYTSNVVLGRRASNECPERRSTKRSNRVAPGEQKSFAFLDTMSNDGNLSYSGRRAIVSSFLNGVRREQKDALKKVIPEASEDAIRALLSIDFSKETRWNGASLSQRASDQVPKVFAKRIAEECYHVNWGRFGELLLSLFPNYGTAFLLPYPFIEVSAIHVGNHVGKQNVSCIGRVGTCYLC
jgi:hypothetical protein